MSRLVGGYEGKAICVTTDTDGTPVRFDDTSILAVIARHREWIGVLDGEPQRDVWRVESSRGVCELHYLCQPIGEESPHSGQWILARWMD